MVSASPDSESPLAPVGGILTDRYRVAIVGSRTSDEVDLVFRIVQKLVKTHGRLVIVSGGSPGGGIDHYARGACHALGFHFCNAEWDDDKKRMVYRAIDPPETGHGRMPLHFVEFPVEDEPKGMSFGSRAYLRNIKVIGAVDMVIAVYAPGKRTPGTTHAIKEALRAGKVCHVWAPATGWVKYGEGNGR